MVQWVGFMVDDAPLVTLVKAKEIDTRPALEEAETALERTLTMLCSFLSVGDLLSFLSSPPFARLARQGTPWLVFELGLYQDHTKTLQLIPEYDAITLADSAATEVFENNLWRGQPDETMEAALERWVTFVASLNQ